MHFSKWMWKETRVENFQLQSMRKVTISILSLVSLSHLPTNLLCSLLQQTDHSALTVERLSHATRGPSWLQEAPRLLHLLLQALRLHDRERRLVCLAGTDLPTPHIQSLPSYLTNRPKMRLLFTSVLTRSSSSSSRSRVIFTYQTHHNSHSIHSFIYPIYQKI